MIRGPLRRIGGRPPLPTLTPTRGARCRCVSGGKGDTIMWPERGGDDAAGGTARANRSSEMQLQKPGGIVSAALVHARRFDGDFGDPGEPCWRLPSWAAIRGSEGVPGEDRGVCTSNIKEAGQHHRVLATRTLGYPRDVPRATGKRR